MPGVTDDWLALRYAGRSNHGAPGAHTAHQPAFYSVVSEQTEGLR